MAPSARRFSIFPQALDGAVFLSYLLGAVVPLVAMGWLAERYALPTLREDVSAAALVGLVSSIAALTLGSFFVLRRAVRQTLERMDGDNDRLAALVEISAALAQAPHGGEVARLVAACARRLCQAEAAFVYLRREKGEPPALVEQAGEAAEALRQGAGDALEELVRLAVEAGRPALRGRPERRGRRGELAAAAVPLGGGAGCLGVALVARRGRAGGFEARRLDALATLASLAVVSLRNADLHDAQKNFFAHVTDILVSALDTHLAVHTGHSRRVAHFCNVMAHRLGFDDLRLQRLHFAALLHDIGMLRIDRDRQTHRPTVQKHPSLGFRMLQPIQLWEDIAPFVHHHHERWDGSGYPEGLAGEAIPFEARIIGLAEAFDTMTSRESYKAPLPFEEALGEIERGAGSQFDPELAALFLELVREGAVRLQDER